MSHKAVFRLTKESRTRALIALLKSPVLRGVVGVSSDDCDARAQLLEIFFDGLPSFRSALLIVLHQCPYRRVKASRKSSSSDVVRASIASEGKRASAD